MDAGSHMGNPPERVLDKQENDKITKYLELCLDMKQDFTALL